MSDHPIDYDRLTTNLERALRAALAEDNAGGGEPSLALVAFDTPGIQRYLFKVRRPVDVYSGSRLIADFTDRDEPTDASLYRHLERAGISADAVIYAGGGGGLVLVPAGRAGETAELLAGILHEQTGGDLRSASAALEVRPEDLGAEPHPPPPGDLAELFGEPPATSRYAATLSALMALLSRERSRVVSLQQVIPASRQDARCSACGGREGRKAGEEILCPPCRRRRRYGGLHKREEDQAKTFEDLVEGTGSKMMAVIYADGANVGHAFQKVTSMAQHRALSLAVDKAFHRAVEAARKEAPLPEDEEERLRFQTPLCGGDDLVLVLPAVAALDAVKAMVPVIEKAFRFADHPWLDRAFGENPSLRRAIEGFGVGVGVAIADHHFPIAFLLGYAKELLASAKRKIREAGCRSAVDFMVLSSGNPLSGSIRDLRRQRYRIAARGGEPRLHLTHRPYTHEGFLGLLRHAAILGEVPTRSQVYALRQEVLHGHALSRNWWRYQHARARPGQGWAKYRAARRVKLADAGALDALLWQDDGDGLSTDLLDAVEILPLVGSGRAREDEV